MFKKILGLSVMALLATGAAMATPAHNTDTQNAAITLTIEPYVAITVPAATIDYDPGVDGLGPVSKTTTVLVHLVSNTGGTITAGVFNGAGLNGHPTYLSWDNGATYGAPISSPFSASPGGADLPLTWQINGLSINDAPGSVSDSVPVTATTS